MRVSQFRLIAPGRLSREAFDWMKKRDRCHVSSRCEIAITRRKQTIVPWNKAFPFHFFSISDSFVPSSESDKRLSRDKSNRLNKCIRYTWDMKTRTLLQCHANRPFLFTLDILYFFNFKQALAVWLTYFLRIYIFVVRAYYTIILLLLIMCV